MVRVSSSQFSLLTDYTRSAGQSCSSWFPASLFGFSIRTRIATLPFRAMRHSDTGQYFPPTHWSSIGRAGQPDSPGWLQAMDELIRRYYPALEAHLFFKYRRSRDEAQDILQEFTKEKLLVNNLLAKADRRRGLFRTYLLNSLDHF